MKDLLTQQYSNIQEKKQRLELLNSAPVFDIELSSACNINCVMCPRTKLRRKLEAMPLDLIKVLIDWFPSNAKVMLCGLGEPLLNNNIFFLISSLKKKGIKVGITTNGLLLTENNIERMIDYGISLIQVSFNGSTKEIYSSIMKNSSFLVVMQNLQYLSKIKIPELTVKLAVVVQKENKNDIENIRMLAAKLGFEVFLRNLHSRGGALAINRGQSVNLPGCGILPRVTFVAANGNILSCSQDMVGKCVLGNINYNSFEDILKEKKRIIDQDSWFPICKYCNDEYRQGSRIKTLVTA